MDKALYDQIEQIENNHWWYMARREIIFEWVFKRLAQYNHPKILDVGCGTGYNIQFLHQHGYKNTYGLDFSPDALRYCQLRNLSDVFCADATTPPLASNAFDFITALDIVEHVEDDKMMFGQFTRLLKPGGSLVIFTPAFNFLWSLQDEVSHHKRRYTASKLRDKVQTAGLNIEKLTYVNMFLFPLIFGGRMMLRFRGNTKQTVSENDLHPNWSNGILKSIFAAERPFLRYANFPLGVSLLCIARKPTE